MSNQTTSRQTRTKNKRDSHQERRPGVRSMKRPLFTAMGVAIILVSGWLAYLYASSSEGATVLVMQNTVTRGQVITDADLTTATIPLDPALNLYSDNGRAQVVGQTAVLDLPAGTPLSEQAISPSALPASGQAIVGMTLPSGKYPANSLTPGDRIRIVDTPRDGDEPPTNTPAAIAAVVTDISYDETTGETNINVTVDQGRSADLLARIATGRIGIAKDPAAVAK